ncbi:MAG: hypothetical protein H6Q75_29 [Firmicutes bacterium]|nr:hypothetical protein [Bacillota bacterium]
MTYILAGLMASLSFLLNRFALRYFGVNAIITYGPVLEESLKSLPAYFLGANIFLIHAIFGCCEGLYDFFSGRNRVLAAIASICGHSAFGAVTVTVLLASDNLEAGIAAAILVHVAWNIVAVIISKRKGNI